MAKRVFLHVGTPKSGTTYLQTALWGNKDALKGAGLLVPGGFQLHYTAAKSVTARTGLAHRTRSRADVAWARLVERTSEWPDSALICHELMAPASAEQAEEAKNILGDVEIHLVLTVRALHKQLPAAWQEQVKAGKALPYDRFLRQIEQGGTERQGRFREIRDALDRFRHPVGEAARRGSWFWRVQDVLDIADRWGGGIPAEHVHIVTCPPTAAEPGLLWRRYASVFGVDEGTYKLDVDIKNMSLGVVEAELLRRIHASGDYRFRDAERHRWTRRLLASSLLLQRRDDPIRFPEHARGWIEERTATISTGIVQRGYDVIGDLGELAWQPPAEHSRLIEHVTDAELADLSAWVIGRLQEELVDRQPQTPYPLVGSEDGIPGILELLEHIRAADTGTMPRPASVPTVGRRIRSLAATLLRR